MSFIIEDFKAYLIPLFSFDPFFVKFDYDLEQQEILGYPCKVLRLFFASDEEVFSRRQNKIVMIDFCLDYASENDVFIGNEEFKKGECRIWISYFETENDLHLIEAFSLEKVSTPDAAVKEFKKFLMNDIRFIDDGDGKVDIPTPVLEPEFEPELIDV
jgi:hypothetical protein